MRQPPASLPNTAWQQPEDTHIVRAAIHPGIGVARIGNSTDEDGYYIGPEVTTPPLTEAGQTRDIYGAIKRQAARFRVYGYNAAGEVVGELNSNNANIQWSVHLANRKAQWYQFRYALDVPEAVGSKIPRRNPKVTGNDRDGLAIDPGPRTISEPNQSGSQYQFDTGTFMGTPVPLGEIRTDEAGHLLVLGGHGHSRSPEGKPIFDPKDSNTFNNADGWFDDTSDGPVTAMVSIAGREIPVDPSWVVVAPPNYAPDVIAWRTLYDLLVDIYVESGWMTLPSTVSFTHDVLPVLRRLSNLQWVNKGFAALFGKGTPFDFDNPDLIAKLAQPPVLNKDNPNQQDDPYEELRLVVFNSFRPANNKVDEMRLWPWIYGDAYNGSDSSPRNNLALSNVRSVILECWVQGDFINDWNGDATSYQNIEELPIADQPAMLDQAALHFCLADAFHPGCEMTWPMRHSSMYMSPFRIRHRPTGQSEPDYGKNLTPDLACKPDGPLYAQGPGDITRWMALPWQADTAFCRSGYDPEYDPYLPTFWPARVPNQVLTQEAYEEVMNTALPREERIAAFNQRDQWLRAFSGSTVDQMLQMVNSFGTMGIVEARRGIENDPDFPAVIFVESLPQEQLQQLEAMAAKFLVERATAARSPRLSLLQKAGWESEEQLEEFRNLQQW